jgi:hypothetical protein
MHYMSEESKLNQGIINRIRRQMSNLMFHVDEDLEIFSIQVNNMYLI